MNDTNQPVCPLPEAGPETGLRVLRGLARRRSLLTALEIMHEEVGDAFRITLPGFQPAVFVGPAGNRAIMVSQSADFRWRSPTDPVARLLRHGVLVEDGPSHDHLRGLMEPVLQRGHVPHHIPAMLAEADRVLDTWANGQTRDMLVEMRRVALLIFMRALLGVDFGPDLERLWSPILRALKYISPGLWILWPDMPRPGYAAALRRLDDYLYALIAARRKEETADFADSTDSESHAKTPGRQAQKSEPGVLASLREPSSRKSAESAKSAVSSSDLLTALIRGGLDDDLIRDQILTMLIAGHDTSTALLAWALHLLGEHPPALAAAVAEVDAVIGRGPIDADAVAQLPYLDMVIKETLRLYPPIHVGNRIAARDTAVCGYEVQAGTRVMASIYLSHRDPAHWEAPGDFRPERFAHADGARSSRIAPPERDSGESRYTPPPPLTYIPFGAGKRVCIGAAFSQVEAKVVLARILQRFDLRSTGRPVHAYMGATLEPRPGVFMEVGARG